MPPSETPAVTGTGPLTQWLAHPSCPTVGGSQQPVNDAPFGVSTSVTQFTLLGDDCSDDGLVNFRSLLEPPLEGTATMAVKLEAIDPPGGKVEADLFTASAVGQPTCQSSPKQPLTLGEWTTISITNCGFNLGLIDVNFYFESNATSVVVRISDVTTP